MAAPLKLLPPPGFGAIVPLDPQRHAGLAPGKASGYSWCTRVNAVYVSGAEMPRASLDYPLAFTREPQTGEFAPVAVFALQQKQNLFVDDAGAWRPLAYVPAYIRRHPFCTAHVLSRDGTAARSLICVEEARLVRSTRPLFDRQGQSTEAWKPILQQLEAIEAALQRTRVFMRRVDALGLLAPFDAIAVLKGGAVKSRLQGLYRIDEKKLADLSARDLRTMLRRSELRWVHSHLNSLDNFSRLFEMGSARRDS